MKTKKISIANNSFEVIDKEFKSSIFSNTTNKVPHVAKSIPVCQKCKNDHYHCLEKIKHVNPYYNTFPSFYKKEIKHYFNLMVVWGIIVILCFILEAIALHFILINKNINNSLSLTLIPGFILCLSFFIIYTQNYINYFNEAKTINFNKGKIVTIVINKLYKRLKTSHININWMCLMTYCICLWTILINYIVAWSSKFFQHQPIDFGNLSYKTHHHHAYLIFLILSIVTIFVTLFLHVTLLIANYIRAAKIDSFYGIQIVSDEEINQIKKTKNKRNIIIFLATTMVIVLLIILIKKYFKKKKNN